MSLISVIVPVYNRAALFADSLATLLEQAEVTTQIVIVDDGSTEDIASVVKQAEKMHDVSIEYIRQDNAGAAAARNVGAKKAKGEYLIFWDADIIAQPQMLSKMLIALEENKDAIVAYSDFMHGEATMVGQPFSLRALKKRNFITTTSLMRTSAFTSFDTTLKRFQDWDLWLQILHKKTDAVYIPNILFAITSEGQTMSDWLPRWAFWWPFSLFPRFANRVTQYKQAEAVIRKKHGIE
ncbi:MAG: glycosyltransferase [Candidatus Magasanikbacteria bacterium]|jgi:glycosyltransferase involved in cell wall biosynthesis|nr:glycosyltransferase [Candidatus Magasanikbacteria bacterium]